MDSGYRYPIKAEGLSALAGPALTALLPLGSHHAGLSAHSGGGRIHRVLQRRQRCQRLHLGSRGFHTGGSAALLSVTGLGSGAGSFRSCFSVRFRAGLRGRDI